MKLKELITDPLNNGLLFYLRNNRFAKLFGVFTAEDIRMLDVEYVENHSGEKTATRFAENTFVASSYNYIMWESLLYARFFKKWTKLLETYDFEYNPIRPYDMHIDTESTDKMTSKTTNTSSETYQDTESSNSKNTTNSNDDVYGFNSTNKVHSDASNGNDTTENNSTTSSNRGINGSSDYVRDNPKEVHIDRYGNIGNTTQQELIERERDIWKWQFFDTVFADIDSILCLTVYE